MIYPYTPTYCTIHSSNASFSNNSATQIEGPKRRGEGTYLRPLSIAKYLVYNVLQPVVILSLLPAPQLSHPVDLGPRNSLSDYVSSPQVKKDKKEFRGRRTAKTYAERYSKLIAGALPCPYIAAFLPLLLHIPLI